MGREIRRVPSDWTHPTDNSGRHKPMFETTEPFLDMVEGWLARAREWEQGKAESQQPGEYAYDARPGGPKYLPYWEWDEHVPNPEYQMPYWPDKERTHYQMYECTSEGTPISPVFATPEEVARYCADHNQSIFANTTTGYKHWERIAKGSPEFGVRLTIGSKNNGC